MSAWTIDTVLAVKEPGSLPLPVQMRIAADVIERANKEHTKRHGYFPTVWSVHLLHSFAKEWQEADAEKAAREAEVEELAKLLQVEACGPSPTRENATANARAKYRGWARRAIDAGWRKSEGES